jgi:phosphoglycerate dehydrogenase-like enzyme
MFTQTGRLIFSAIDLIDYLGCCHATFLDLAKLDQPRVAVKSDPHEELLKKKGIEHELRHLAYLKNQGKRIAIIDPYSSSASRRRAEALRNTGALLTFNTSKELRSGEAKLLDGARLIQFMIGGVDFIPLGELPEGVPVATNGGGYAESMAEHALAMALAAKRLILEHENLKLGQFNQFTRNRMLAGGVCGIFGFGGIGAATARLMRGIGMRVHAINRHGRTDARVDWIGTPERLNELLEAADVLLISAPLTRAT